MKFITKTALLGFTIACSLQAVENKPINHQMFDDIKTAIYAISDWADNFFDKKSKQTLLQCRQELQNNILPLLDSLKQYTPQTSLEKEIAAIGILLSDKFNKAYTALNKGGNRFTLGNNLKSACYLPDLLKELKDRFYHLANHAYQQDAILGQIVTEFKNGFFNNLYYKWYPKKSMFYLNALGYRINCK